MTYLIDFQCASRNIDLVDTLYCNKTVEFCKLFRKYKIAHSLNTMLLSFSNIFKHLNICEKYRNLRKEWPHKTPKGKWMVLCDIPKTLLAIFGIRILEDCRVYWLSFFGSFLALNYFSLASYTLIYFARDGRFMHGTRCLCGVGIVATVCFFLYTLFFPYKNSQNSTYPHYN